MGVDCRFIAENLNGVTREDIEKDIANEAFPKSDFRAGPETVVFISKQIYDGFLVLGDTCRLFSERGYQVKVLEYLRKKCGGRAGVIGDIPQDIEDVINAIKQNPCAWLELKSIRAED